MACFLPSWYKVYCVLVRSRYKVYKWPGTYPGTQICKWALAQSRGTRFLSGHEFIRVQKVVNGIGRVSGCRFKIDPGKWLKVSKKHDKQLTFIGRVIGSLFVCLGVVIYHETPFILPGKKFVRV